MRTYAIVLSASLSLAACGFAMHAIPDIDGFHRSASDLKTSVDRHRTNMMTVETEEACQAEHLRYDGEARPLVERMRMMAGDMDACMRAMGHEDQMDFATTCQELKAELDRHKSSACASTDPAVNRTEAARHADGMGGHTGLMMSRGSGMHGMMSNGMMSGGICRR